MGSAAQQATTLFCRQAARPGAQLDAHIHVLLVVFLSLWLIVPGGDRRPVQEFEVAPGGETKQTFHDAHDGQSGLHRGGELNPTERPAKEGGSRSGRTREIGSILHANRSRAGTQPMQLPRTDFFMPA